MAEEKKKKPAKKKVKTLNKKVKAADAAKIKGGGVHFQH